MHNGQSGSVMRLAGRRLATPVRWHRHAGTGRTLILVLNDHLGAPAYFAAMLANIRALEAAGWAVQWEGIRKAGDQAWATASDAERAARQVMLDLYRDRPRAAAARYGWVYQGDVLPEPEETTDLTDLDLIRAAGPDAILALGQAVDAAQARLGRHRAEHEAVMLPLTLRRLARPHGPLSAAIAALAPAVMTVLLAQRSKLAVAGLDPARDTVMVWGAEHADTIEAELAAAGWELTSRRAWLEVGRLPSLARSFAAVLAVSCRVGADTWRTARAALADPGAA